jgi:hypothetical protein
MTHFFQFRLNWHGNKGSKKIGPVYIGKPACFTGKPDSHLSTILTDSCYKIQGVPFKIGAVVFLAIDV